MTPLLQVPELTPSAIAIAAATMATVIALITVRNHIRTRRAPTSYLGFPIDELTEISKRLDMVDSEHQRARALGFAIQCSTDRPRLLSIRPLGVAGRHTLFGPSLARVELILEGPTHVEGTAPMREIAALLPNLPSRQTPRLSTAIYEGDGVLLVFETAHSSQPLTLRLAELAVA